MGNSANTSMYGSVRELRKTAEGYVILSKALMHLHSTRGPEAAWAEIDTITLLRDKKIEVTRHLTIEQYLLLTDTYVALIPTLVRDARARLYLGEDYYLKTPTRSDQDG